MEKANDRDRPGIERSLRQVERERERLRDRIPEARDWQEGPEWVIGVALRETEEGLRVSGVMPRQAAAKAGVREGDLILTLNHFRIDGLPKLRELIQLAEGESVELEVRRGDGKVMIEVTPQRAERRSLSLRWREEEEEEQEEEHEEHEHEEEFLEVFEEMHETMEELLEEIREWREEERELREEARERAEEARERREEMQRAQRERRERSRSRDKDE